MYRAAAKRLLLARSRIPIRRASAHSPSCVSSLAFTHDQNPNPKPEPVIHSESSSSTSTSTSDEYRRRFDGHASGEAQGPGGYLDEQARVLSASLRYVHSLGWTEAAMVSGAREAGLSPAIIGSLPRKEAALVEFFMDECLQKLIDTIESDKELQNLIPSERISKLVRIRLEMQVPFISKWHEALSIQAQPQNIPSSFKQRAMLADEIWHAAGDDSNDIDWYAKRTVLGTIYSSTEVYMLTDNSPDFRDTWAFLDGRVKDAFDLKKTFQEVSNLAEAVNAGLGGSLQGFVKKIFQGQQY